MAKYTRKRLLVDPQVQGSLVRHAVGYWLCCMGTVEFLNLTWQIATGPEQASFLGYFFNQNLTEAGVRIVAGSVLVLPLIVFDTLRESNRFAGPVFRMQRILKRVAVDGVVEPIRLRDGDYWHDFAADLNAALARLAGQNEPGPAIKVAADWPPAV